MAAHRIRATTTNNVSLPRCKSEGTLIDISDGVSEASLMDVKGQLLRLESVFNGKSSCSLSVIETGGMCRIQIDFLICEMSKTQESIYYTCQNSYIDCYDFWL